MFDLHISSIDEARGRLELRPLSDRAVYMLEHMLRHQVNMLELVPLDITQAFQLHGRGLWFN